MNIQDFKSNFGIGDRPTLYKVQISGLPQKLEFVAKVAQLPGRTLGEIEVPFMGKKIKIAGDDTYETLPITVLLDVDFAVRNELEIWQAKIKAAESSSGAENISDYYGTASVIKLNSKDEEIAVYDFIDCWPSVVGPVELGFENTDQISEYTVDFTYNFWQRTK